MGRLAWAALGGRGDESKLLFRWRWQSDIERPATPEDYQRKAMAAWAGAGGGITLSPPPHSVLSTQSSALIP